MNTTMTYLQAIRWIAKDASIAGQTVDELSKAAVVRFLAELTNRNPWAIASTVIEKRDFTQRNGRLEAR